VTWDATASRNIATPHLDQLARDGTRFTNFLVAQPVCTASRTALKLDEIATGARRDLGDAITGARGEGVRACARKP